MAIMAVNLLSLIILILIIDQQVMLASRVHQIIPHPTKPQAQINELVIGVCDYIPYSLKFKQSLKIAIDGDPQTVVNTVLWSEYFHKTILKECQQHFFLTYASQGEKSPSAIFIKNRQKIYKFEENLQWNSLLRKDMMSSMQRQQTIQIQTYSKTGSIRTISIFFGEYVHGQGIDLLLKLIQSENFILKPIQAKKAENIGKQTLDQAKKVISIDFEDKVSQKNEMKLSKNSEKSFSTFKSKSKFSENNKENSKTSKVAPQKAPSSLKSKKVLEKKCNNSTSLSTTNRKQEAKPIKQQTVELIQEKLLPKQPNYGRQRVISKILSSKQQALMLLKQKLVRQEVEFEQCIKQERASHEQQMHSITQSIKSVLDEYKAAKIAQESQIFYLKERVKTLQAALSRRQTQSEQNLVQLSTLINAKREAQDQLKRKSNEVTKLKEQHQAERKLLYEQNKRYSEQLQRVAQKSLDYQRKYEGLVNIMRRNLPNCEEERFLGN